MKPELWYKIDELFHAALKQDVAERDAFLVEACAGNEALRREVESLLASHEGEGNFLGAPPSDLAAGLLQEGDAPSLLGQTLGHYKIVGLLGVGGMGQVYQAHDTKLGREVAIKVLPDAFARNRERLARFEREAQILASFNHPNIAGIYGLEESSDIRFLVLELVPGQTLAERLEAGRLPVEEALAICRQVAEGLEAAHGRGIVHRDLKPANIKITAEGKVKLLDFGLAKDTAFAGPKSVSSGSPKLTAGSTRAGEILGTTAYMSPDQARGKPVDKRADIWSFGCVLYEALTGRQLFAGETVSDSIAKILEREPNWEALPETTPVKIRELLEKCLRKDAGRRLHDIADARIDIEDSVSAPAAAAPGAATRTAGRLRDRLLLGGACLLAGGLIAGVSAWYLKPPPAPPKRPVSHFVLPLEPGERLAGLDLAAAVASSPDGSQLVYVANRGGIQQLDLHAMDQLESRPIAGTERGSAPFFSPNGKWVGFFAEGKLKKVSLTGGPPVNLCEASRVLSASWGADDAIVFSRGFGGLSRVSAAGGTATTLTSLDLRKGERSHDWPELLPDGEQILFTVTANSGGRISRQIVAVSLRTGKRRLVLEDGTNARYSSTRHLVFLRKGKLMAVRFDPARPEVQGEPVAMVEGVMESSWGTGQFSLSSLGSLVYMPGEVQLVESRLVWVDRHGTEEELKAPSRDYLSPRLSPDGRRVAVTIRGASNSDVSVCDLPCANLTPLTFQGINTAPIWTPDGKRVTYGSSKVGPVNLFWKPVDMSGEEESLATSEYSIYPQSWSPDNILAFVEDNPTTKWDIWRLSLNGDRKPLPLIQTPSYECSPAFSPDGHWLAYTSYSPAGVYVQPYPGRGGKRQISSEGGSEPVWARSGRELFYRNGDKMMAVEISTDPVFTVGKTTQLFQGNYEKLSIGSNYDVNPDGRFLMIKRSQREPSGTQLHIVHEWFEVLKSRLPSDKN